MIIVIKGQIRQAELLNYQAIICINASAESAAWRDGEVRWLRRDDEVGGVLLIHLEKLHLSLF